MRTTLTIIISCVLTLSAFAQKTNKNKSEKKPLIGYTQLTAGIAMPTIMNVNSNAVSTRNAMGWTAGVQRNKILSNHFDIAYGMNLLKASQQIAFTESTLAYDDSGFRNYDALYVRFPVEFKYNIKPKGPFYVNSGITTNYMLLNRSMESFVRAHRMDDAGNRFDKPINEDKLQFRNVNGFDVTVKVGAGMNFKFNDRVFTAAVSYSQGLITKDMGFKAGSLEMTMSMTLPSYHGFKRTPSPASWLD
jgi:hypothetical protein